MNFILLPLPNAPTYGALRVNTASTGATALQALASPLMNMVHRPSLSRRAVPLIGQSSSATPAAASVARARSLSAIGRVLVSITIARRFDFRDVAISAATASSALTEGSEAIITSASSATAALEPSGRPPARRKRVRAGARTSVPTTRWPASISAPAMALPMMPRPITPTTGFMLMLLPELAARHFINSAGQASALNAMHPVAAADRTRIVFRDEDRTGAAMPDRQPDRKPMTAVPRGLIHVPVTPMTPDNEIDLATFARVVEFLIGQNAAALCVNLHLAESLNLTLDERKALAQRLEERRVGKEGR